MPWAAAMTSSMLIPARTFAQNAVGAWTPNNIDWSKIIAVPCRIFPVTAAQIKSIWGEALQVDVGAWISADTILPPQVLTTDSGQQTPVKVDGVIFMVQSVSDLANMHKLKSVALKRFSHG